MPDSIQPVGAMIQPPNAASGINTLSGILGLQQQRQQIDIGQTQVQQQQQMMKERQFLQGMMSSGKDDQGNGILDANGAPDPSKIMPAISRNMPLTGQPVIQNIIKTQTDKTQLSDATRQLKQNYRNDASGIIRSFMNTDAKADDVNKALDSYGTNNPDAIPAIHWATNLIDSHFDGMPPEKKNDALLHLAQQFQPSATTAAQQQPSPTAVQAPGNRLSFVETNPLAAGGAGTTLGQAAQGLAPYQQPGYIAQAAGATARGGGTGNADVDRANAVGDVQQQSSAAIELTKRIDQLSDEIGSGHLAKMISEGGNYLGFGSVNEARSELLKDLGQVKGLAISRAGSDSRAATILEGYPTDTTPAHTTHVAMDYIRGTARQNLARGQLLSQYQASPDGVKGFQAADNIMTGSTDPLMHEYMALKPGEKTAFYQRNFASPQEAQEFKNKVSALQKHTSLGQ